ncbi:Rap1 GTPase-GDP dissociation stimulator 1 [Entomophthora muscae]|uniref:Rap1 GTPase-GDP dissociation stimulator 1 n=2 Tax=Entomophthora muscae TaxID=34485 RepID=A0ACC2S8F5_9FUNG|nr:Rap1 GTPase-GDP dissociation stimulator 1 [Entomophthora muscae]
MFTLEEVNGVREELSKLQEPEQVQSYYGANGSKLMNYLSQLDKIGVVEFKIFSTICEIYAYYGKFVETRTDITKSYDNIFADLAGIYLKARDVLPTEDILPEEILKFEVQFHRALGNLTIDDDSSRQRILDSGIINQVVKGLGGTKNEELRKVRTGFLLNVSLGFSPVRKQFSSQEYFQAVLSSLSLNCLEAEEYVTVYLCLELLSNLLEEEICTKVFSQDYSNVQALIKPLSFYKINQGEYDVPIMTHLVESIEGCLNDNENVHAAFVSDGSLSFFCGFLEASNNIAERYPKLKKEVTGIFTVIERIIVLVSSHNDNMNLFDDAEFMKSMCNWMSQREDPQLMSCAALVLGNLARTDQNCIKMVQKLQIQNHLVPILEEATDLSLLHGIVGVLKNLSIPAENKTLLGTSRVIKSVAPLLEKHTAQPLQFGVAGLLKHLSNRNDKNALAMCSTENEVDGVLPITRLRLVIQKSDQQGIQSEATRAIMNITKAVYSSNETFEKYGAVITANTAIQPVIDLVMQTKFPILQSEAIITLALLSSIRSPDTEAIIDALVEPSSTAVKQEDGVLTEKDALEMIPFPQAVEDMLLASMRPYATEIRLNVLTFLEQVFKYCLESDATLERLRARFGPIITTLLSEKEDALRDSAERLHSSYFN